MVLEISNLSVEFDVHEGTAHVLDNVSLDVHENEIVALVGESGSGKSVTARSVLGTLSQPPGRITDGTISYRGKNLLELSDSDHSKLRGTEIGMIPQDPLTGLNPVYTVGEQLTDLIKWQGVERVGLIRYAKDKLTSSRDTAARKAAIEILEQVKIPDPESTLERYPVELSGGLRQRVLIGMALVGKPELLIADEPTTALDVTITQQILDVLEQRCRAKGLGVLYITHNLGVAYQLSDRIYVMYGGRIVETGPTEELFADPQHPYTRGLLDAVPTLDVGIGRGMEGEVPDYTAPPQGCRFHPRCPDATAECREYRPVLSQIDDTPEPEEKGATGSTRTELSTEEAGQHERENATRHGSHVMACFLDERTPKTKDRSQDD